MLSKFNPNTGKPIKIQKILRWHKLTSAIVNSDNAPENDATDWLNRRIYQIIKKPRSLFNDTAEYRKISQLKELANTNGIYINEAEMMIRPPDDFDMRNKEDAIDNLIVELLNHQLYPSEEDEEFKEDRRFY